MSLILAPRPHFRPPPTDGPSVDPVRAWLARLAAPTPDLCAFAPAILNPDSHLCPAEYDATARAMGCPDLFVIHAPDPTIRERIISGVSRVTAIEAVAEQAGARVLVLSPDPAMADRIVERLARLDVRVVRALADDENPIRPSPVVARATATALGTTWIGQLKREAAAAVAAATDRLDALARAITTLTRLAELSGHLAAIDDEINTLTAERDRVEQCVQGEVAGKENPRSAFTTLLAERGTEDEATLTHLHTRRLVAQTAREEKETAVANLRKQAVEPGADVGKKPGFFARLLGKPKPGAAPTELEKQLHEAQRELSELVARVAALQDEMDATTTRLATERERRIQTEIELRRAAIDSRLSTLTAEGDRLRTEAEAATHLLGVNPPTANELAETHTAAERELATARQRATELDGSEEELIRGFLAQSRVVVGTPGSLGTDPVFHHDPLEPTSVHPFGLLVLDRAEELTEGDFVRLAKLAPRWILIGNVTIPEESKPYLNGASPRHPAGAARPFDVSFASRLARSLDRETWLYETDRLTCRLMHLSAEQRRGMTREPLLDRPEIELRFASSSSGEPLLAEVAFPLATSIAGARSFLYHQLGEILLRPCGEAVWHLDPTAITACWSAAEHGTVTTDVTWIDLEPGIREKVVGAGITAYTAAITFDPATGWDSEKAAAWLNERLPTESVSRYAVVTRR